MKIFDTDVHPTLRGREQVFPYIDEAWQQYFSRQEFKISGRSPERYPHPGVPLRADARPPDGELPATDPEFVRKDLLDAWEIEAGLLISVQAAAVNAWTDPPAAHAFTAATNELFYQEWVAADPRFKLAITISPHDPEASAGEIEKWAGREGVVAVQLPLLNILMGNRHYYPIYEAAERAGLPVVVHQTGAEGCYIGTPVVAGGVPRSYAERHAMLPQVGQSSVVSLVFEGVFERFPKLKIAFVEYGFSWLLPLLWRMDREWKNFRFDTPWVKRPPKEYVKEHMRFSTQPMDEPDKVDDLWKLIELLGGEDLLMFSSDYPHYDNDNPLVTLKKLPEGIRERIASTNAHEFFGV
jgi:predicted TIM-barrel fold metal-dependent hydrolase